jgi:hypothetical protein
VIIYFQGGDRLKFGDVIIAAASVAVIFVLLAGLLSIALVPVNTALGDVANYVSIFVSALVVGYVFAGKIREESRMASIGKIIFLVAVLMMFGITTFFAAIGHYGPWVDEFINSNYPGHGVTNADWMAYENMVLFAITGMYVALSLVLSLVGLYVGSMRKPSAKAKE